MFPGMVSDSYKKGDGDMMKNDTLPPQKQQQQKEYNDYVKQVADIPQ